MRKLPCLLFVLALTLCTLAAQTPASSARDRSARNLLEASGIREQFSQMMGSFLDTTTKAMAGTQPDGSSCNDSFIAEWKKRFSARLSADKFIDVLVPIYGKHFTKDELDQMTAIRVAAKQGKTLDTPKPLLEKMQKEAIDIQSETIGATTQLGARVGGEVGQQINTEHPDWCTQKQK